MSVAEPRVALVIVNHDTRDDLLGCLASVHADGAVAVDELVVVDSGSSDGSLEAVAARYPAARGIALPNVGFGAAANAGVAETRASAVVIANADTRFPPGAAAAMADYLAAHPDVGVLGPLVRHPDGRLQHSARRLPSLSEAVGHALLGLWRPDNRWTRAYRMTDWHRDSARDVDWVSGCALAVRREAFAAVAGFDPRYFMFLEDVDLCLRLRAAGWRVVFAPVAEVTHAVGGAVARRPVRMVLAHARSLDRFVCRNFTRGWRRVVRPLLRVGIVGWALMTAAWTLVRRRPSA